MLEAQAATRDLRSERDALQRRLATEETKTQEQVPAAETKPKREEQLRVERAEARLASVERERDQLAVELERIVRRRQGGSVESEATRSGVGIGAGSADNTAVPSGTSSLHQYAVPHPQRSSERAAGLESELHRLRAAYSDLQAQLQEATAALQQERRQVAQSHEELQRYASLLHQAQRSTEGQAAEVEQQEAEIQNLKTQIQDRQRQSSKWQADSNELRRVLQDVDAHRDRLQEELDTAVSRGWTCGVLNGPGLGYVCDRA